MIAPSSTAFELTFLDLDEELSSLEWTKNLPQPSEELVSRITDLALHEYSLRAFGDLAFNGLGRPVLEFSALLLGGRPLDRMSDYRI